MPFSQIHLQRTQLIRYVSKHVRDAAYSEDIVQEAYLRLLKFKLKPGVRVINVQGLLRRIALNLVRDHFRHSGRVAVEELSEALPCPHSAIDLRLEQKQLVELVARVLKTMPPLRRDVFIRRRLHDQSAGEVGRELGLSPSAVSNHVARALLDLDYAIEKIEKRGSPDRP